MKTLLEWEDALSIQLKQVQLIGELDLTDELLHELGGLIASRVKQASSLQVATDALEQRYPACLAIYLVAHGVFRYREGNYWSEIATDTGCGASSLSTIWGRFFRAFLHERHLADFDVPGAHVHVTRILLHGGIPDFCLPDFFDRLLLPCIADVDFTGFDAQELIDDWLKNQARYAVDKPVERFLTHGGKMATDFVERCARMASDYMEDGAASIDAQHSGLPMRVVRCFELTWTSWQKKNQQTQSRLQRLQRPRLQMDPWGKGLEIFFPEQQLPRSAKEPILRWLVEGKTVQSIRCRSVEEGWLAKAHFAPITAANQNLAIELSINNETIRQWLIPLFSEYPLACFDPDSSELILWKDALPGRRLWLLYRADAYLTAHGGLQFEELPDLPGEWSTFQLQGWDLTQASFVEVDGQALPVIHDTRPSVIGDVQSGIYTSPPEIVLPEQTESDLPRWRLKGIDGDGRSIFDASLLQLSQALNLDQSGIRIALQAAILLDKDAFGEYEITLTGALGKGTLLQWRILIIPGLQIFNSTHLRIPDSEGHLPEAILEVNAPRDCRIHSSCEDVAIESLSATQTKIVVLPRHDLDFVQLSLNRETQQGLKIIQLRIELPILRRTLITSDTDVVSASMKPLPISLSKLVFDDTPEAWLMTSLTREMRCEAHVNYAEGREPQVLLCGRRHQTYGFNLRLAIDSIRTSDVDEIKILLRLHEINSHALTSYQDIVVIRLTQTVAIETLTAQGIQVDQEWLIEARWQGILPAKDRCLRLWSLNRPWVEPYLVAIPNSVSECVITIACELLLPGNYCCDVGLRPLSGLGLLRPARSDKGVCEINLESPDAQPIKALMHHSLDRLVCDSNLDDSQKWREAFQDYPSISQAQKLLAVLVVLAERGCLVDHEGSPSALYMCLQSTLSLSPEHLLVEALDYESTLSPNNREYLKDVLWLTSDVLGKLHQDITNTRCVVDKDLEVLLGGNDRELMSRNVLWTAIRSRGIQINSQPLDEVRSDLPLVLSDYDQYIADLDWLGLYMREASQYSLLTSYDERALALAIAQGNQATERLDNSDEYVSPLRRLRLQKMVGYARMARDRFVLANLRLVIDVARRYWNQGLPNLDVLQEGVLGLLKAIKKFDPNAGTKFSTYATWWIRQAAADQGRVVRLPVHLFEIVKKIRRARYQFAQRMGRDPYVEELAEALDLPVKKIAEYLGYEPSAASLDAPLNEEDDDLTMGDIHPSTDDMDNPAFQGNLSMARIHINAALQEIGARKREMMQLRFGLVDGETHTLEEIGEIYGLTRERVRQIEERALHQLKWCGWAETLHFDYALLTAREFFGLTQEASLNGYYIKPLTSNR